MCPMTVDRLLLYIKIKRKIEMEYRPEEIGGGVKVFVSKEHTFGTDALLLAYFVGVKNGERVCDLGSGCGIIPFWWNRYANLAETYAVEIDHQAVDQMQKAVEANGMEGKFIPIEADMRELKGKIPFGMMDVVSCNPPYFAVKSGPLNNRENRSTARHETECTMEDVCTVAAKLLRYGGKFAMCQKPERLVDAFEAMRKAGIEPKRVRFVKQGIDKEPWLFLVEGRFGGGKQLTVEPDLIIGKDANGEYGEELKKIYEGYAEEKVRNER